MKRVLAAFAALAVVLGTDLHADSLDTGAAPVVVDPDAPRRGMTMDRVQSDWGQPQSQRSAVGDPPITRWEYAGFTVYFEYDRVIHTVVSRR